MTLVSWLGLVVALLVVRPKGNLTGYPILRFTLHASWRLWSSTPASRQRCAAA
jgi:hypothetical protein